MAEANVADLLGLRRQTGTKLAATVLGA